MRSSTVLSGLGLFLSVVCLCPARALADDDPNATVGSVIEIPLLVSTPDEGSIVLVVAPEIGETPMKFGDDVVVVPVSGGFVRARRPFSVAAGVSVLDVTV